MDDQINLSEGDSIRKGYARLKKYDSENQRCCCPFLHVYCVC